MEVPRRSYMSLRSKLNKVYPKLAGRDDILDRTDDVNPDTTNLQENKPQYDDKRDADVIIRNARTSVGGEGSPESIAILDNVIVAKGPSENIDAYKGKDTEIIDAEGYLVLPGFCDSHLHLLVGAQRLNGCDMETVRDARDFRKRLSAFAAEKSDRPVLYVYGLHYCDPPIIPAGNARHFIDGIVSDKPVLVYAHDIHTAWANTRAIEDAGILHKMPPFPAMIEELDLKENIVLGADGLPSGEFREPEVYFMVEAKLQSKYPQPVEESLSHLRAACDHLVRNGFTSVHRMGLSHPVEDVSFLIMLLELEQRGELPLRVNTSVSCVADAHMLDDVIEVHAIRRALTEARAGKMTVEELYRSLIGRLKSMGSKRGKRLEALAREHRRSEKYPLLSKIVDLSRSIERLTRDIHIRPHIDRKNPYGGKGHSGYLDPDSKVRCNTLKIFMDGVIEKDTAYRIDEDPPEGIPEFTQEELDSVIILADKLGVQVAAHSIGNASVRSMLDAIEKARDINAAVDRRRGHKIPHRIEHIELCEAEDIKRFGRQQVIASMQPLHERPPVRMWHKKVPEKYWSTAFAWKDILAAGTVLVYGSDWPIVPCDVRKSIPHAVERKAWTDSCTDQSVSLEQALDSYTKNAAFTEYAQQRKGSIAPGQLADIVILKGEPQDFNVEKAGDMDVLMTICDGKIVHDGR